MKKESLEKKIRIFYLAISLLVITFLFFFDTFKNSFNYRTSILSEIILEELSFTVLPPKAGYLCGFNNVVDFNAYQKCQENYSKGIINQSKVTFYNKNGVPLRGLNLNPVPDTYDANYKSREYFHIFSVWILYFLTLFFIWKFRVEATNNIINKIIKFYKKI